MMGDAIINNCRVDNSIITGDGRNTAGVLGGTLNKLEISNINVTGSTIRGTANSTGYNRNCDCVAGVVGYVGNTSSYKNIKVDDCIITGKESGNVSGILGCCNDYSSAFESFKDCVVSNTHITSEVEIAKLGYSVSNSTASGLIGRISKVNVDNCDIINCNIDGKGIIIAGEVASCDSITATNCNVSGTTITNEPEIKCTYPYAYRVVSGFLGSSTSNSKFDNIKISNVSITGKAESAGGIYGFVNNLDRLSNCNVNELTINTRDVDAEVIGASAGIGANTSSTNCTITNCNVSNSEITTDAHIVAGMFGYFYQQSTIANCKTDNVILKHNNIYASKYDPVVGGLVGINDGTITLSSCSVKNGNLSSEEGTKGILYIGGILGFAEDDAKMNNVEIANTSINNKTSGGITGGIVAMTNYLVSDTEKIVRKLTINDSNIVNCKNIVGNNHVGGVLGFGKLIANNTTISDTVIKAIGSFGDAGGIAGNTLEDTIINGVTANRINVSGIYRAGGILGFSKGSVENINISNSTIIATGDTAEAGGIVGLASVLSSRIYNCIANLIEVKSVNGYVGGIVGCTNNAIIDCSVTDSKVESTGASPKGVGGIAGFAEPGVNIQNPIVSNNTLTDTAIKGDIVGAPSPINEQIAEEVDETLAVSEDDSIEENVEENVQDNTTITKAPKDENNSEENSGKLPDTKVEDKVDEKVDEEAGEKSEEGENGNLTEEPKDEKTDNTVKDDTNKELENKVDDEPVNDTKQETAVGDNKDSTESNNTEAKEKSQEQDNSSSTQENN